MVKVRNQKELQRNLEISNTALQKRNPKTNVNKIKIMVIAKTDKNFNSEQGEYRTNGYFQIFGTNTKR